MTTARSNSDLGDENQRIAFVRGEYREIDAVFRGAAGRRDGYAARYIIVAPARHVLSHGERS